MNLTSQIEILRSFKRSKFNCRIYSCITIMKLKKSDDMETRKKGKKIIQYKLLNCKLTDSW